MKDIHLVLVNGDRTELRVTSIKADSSDAEGFELLERAVSPDGLRFRIREIHPPDGSVYPLNSRLLPTVPDLEERYGPWGQEEAP